jgi:HxlR-like helix-turn-helix
VSSRSADSVSRSRRSPWGIISASGVDDLGISRTVLTERLNWLVESGVLERRRYQDHPPRYEYVLTGKGTELVDMLMVMVAWGDRWADDGAGPPVLYRHRACGEISHVELRCAHCGTIMRADDVELLDGPGADT